MRLATCIVIELTLAGALVVGATWAGARGLALVRDGRGPSTAPSTAPWGPPALRSRTDLSALPDLRVSLEATGTFMGMSDELLLNRVRHQPIARFKLNHGGSSLSFRVDFADGSRAAWKPTQTNLQSIPRKEVAAYRLNRLLGMNAVPPAAPRAVSREELFSHLHPDSVSALPRIQAETVFGPMGKTIGTASYWIATIKDSGFDTPAGRQQMITWLTAGQRIPVEQRAMAAQLSDLVLFDFLTANPDRYSGGNMKMSPDGAQLFFMDNAMSFFVGQEGTHRNYQNLLRTQRFSRTRYEALSRISIATLERILSEDAGGPYEILTPAEIKAVVARRDMIRTHIDALVGELGSKAVFAFP